MPHRSLPRSDCALFVFISKRELPFDVPKREQPALEPPQKLPSAAMPRPLFGTKQAEPDAPAAKAVAAEPNQSMRKKIGA